MKGKACGKALIHTMDGMEYKKVTLEMEWNGMDYRKYEVVHEILGAKTMKLLN